MHDSAPRSRRRWAIVLAPVLVTVLLGVVVGGFVVVQSLQQSDRIEEADAAGSDYLSRVATFRVEVAEALDAVQGDDPGDLLRALRDAVSDPPVLEESNAFGMEQSTTYAEARDVEATLLDPYTELDETLGTARRGLAFVTAAREALALRATDYIDGTVLDDSAQVRGSLIPAFVEARDELADVPVPKGQEQLAATVRDAVQTVIDRATALAASIEQNRSYTFSYGDVYTAAATAVDDYATQVEGDLTEALTAIDDLVEQA